VRWYVEQSSWWEAIRADPEYRRYHDRNYGNRKTLARQTAAAD